MFQNAPLDEDTQTRESNKNQPSPAESSTHGALLHLTDYEDNDFEDNMLDKFFLKKKSDKYPIK